MTDAAVDADPVEDVDVDEDVPDDEEDEQPAIGDEEMVDFGDVAESIEAETGPDAGAGDDQDDVDDEPDDQEDSSDDADLGLDADSADAERSVSVGTVYCNGLGMGAAVARTSLGTADEDERDELMGEYRDVAEQLEIDKCVDEWLEERGGVDELSPGQATIVLTALWCGMVAMDDPDMVGNLVEEVGN